MTSSSRDFPDSPVGKESTCSAGDSSSIPGSGRPPGEGIGYPLPLQDSWAPLVAQLENPTAMQETWVRSLGRGDPLEKGKATLSSIWSWRLCTSQWGCKESDMTERLSLSLSPVKKTVGLSESWPKIAPLVPTNTATTALSSEALVSAPKLPPAVCTQISGFQPHCSPPQAPHHPLRYTKQALLPLLGS